MFCPFWDADDAGRLSGSSTFKLPAPIAGQLSRFACESLDPAGILQAALSCQQATALCFRG